MLDGGRQEVLSVLDEGRKALLLALDGVGQEEAVWKADGREWSILECAEHVALVEEFLLGKLEAARPADEGTASRSRAAVILARGADRQRRVEAPDAVRPSGVFGSLPEALAKFSAVRGRTVVWVNRLEVDPRSLATDHPVIPGPVNCYEMLLLIALHPKRHAGQIGEMRMAWRDREGRPGSGPIPV